jgi:CRP/FNR family cyclic AMP-dependent transcriptional regulator
VARFLRSSGAGTTIVTYHPADVIFSQGDASNSVLYIQTGTVKLSVLSSAGKEAVVGMLVVIVTKTVTYRASFGRV